MPHNAITSVSCAHDNKPADMLQYVLVMSSSFSGFSCRKRAHSPFSSEPTRADLNPLTITIGVDLMSQQTTHTIDDLAVNTIKFLAVDGVEKAKSGHPGLPMGASDMAYVLWTKFLRYNPADPKWPNRDRFILSGGHGSMLLYSLLHLAGYDMSIDDLKQFRQVGSETPGHPEYNISKGIETTTGPLGQGLANAVGMAMAAERIAAIFNKPGYDIIDHRIYAMAGDGDMMEGVSHEACSLAGHLGLGNIIVIYDDNQISIEGSTSLTCSDDVQRKVRVL